MSKKTIYILLIILSCSLALLLYLEFSYFGSLYRIRRENFDEATGRALSRAVRDLEISETKEALSPAARAELDALD
ncbi:MAG: two-component sensor histidine kinase, partial [Alloprevotella sp.]|nr:two-component sensor histidine kinase [Alloprevotella sp.]